MAADILGLKVLVGELRARDRACRVFGSESHRYRIGPPLSEAEVSAFEGARGIVLPEEFRLYLTLVGDGRSRVTRLGAGEGAWMEAGAGPGYGVYPLAAAWCGASVREPFPFSEAVDLPEGSPFDFSDGDVPGALEIGTHGCSSHTHLIISGPGRGAIWEGYDYDHFSPTHPSFAAWMRAWAERSLSALANEEKLKGVRPGMTREQVEDATGVPWQEHENSYSKEFYLAAAGFAAQILLSGKSRVVTKVKLHPFV